MVSSILVSHGPLASAFIKNAEMISGKKEGLYAMELDGGESPAHFLDRLEALLCDRLNQGEVIVVSDLLLGTPFNVAVQLMERYPFRHLTGMNASMILSLLCDCTETDGAEELCRKALCAASERTLDVNKFLKDNINK